jgi:hypothetical protein
MGNTEQEQAEAMKRFIREVFVPEYAKNFNKGLSAEDIKFYGKIHFNRNRSENELNMHCHLIVSRKDQSNKVKISPLTNHRNTKQGAIKGGFDRVTLFENAEKGFDKLFGFNRQLSETFEYCNAMKNGSIADKLKMKEKEIVNTTAQQQVSTSVQQQNSRSVSQQISESVSQSTSESAKQSFDFSNVDTLFSVFPSGEDISLNIEEIDEQQPRKLKKKKKQRRIS